MYSEAPPCHGCLHPCTPHEHMNFEMCHVLAMEAVIHRCSPNATLDISCFLATNLLHEMSPDVDGCRISFLHLVAIILETFYIARVWWMGRPFVKINGTEIVKNSISPLHKMPISGKSFIKKLLNQRRAMLLMVCLVFFFGRGVIALEGFFFFTYDAYQGHGYIDLLDIKRIIGHSYIY